MKIRFLADADLNVHIVTGVLRREPAIDFQRAEDAAVRALPDPDVLAMAAEAQRILVTHDSSTMPRHFRELIAAGNRSPGVLVVPQRLPIGTAIDELVTVWLASDSEEWVDQIAWLPL